MCKTKYIEKAWWDKRKEKDGAQRVYSENRCVIKRLRNTDEESASLIVCGREFQSLGAEFENASWCVFQQHLDCVGMDERRDRAGVNRGMSSCKYSGAVL